MSPVGKLLVASLWLAAGAGCAHTDKPDGAGDTDTGGAADTDTGSDSGGGDSETDSSGSDDTGEDPNAATLSGKVVWSDGTPASSGVHARLCLLVCRSDTADSSGGFSFSGADPGTYALEIVALGQQDDYATPQVPVILTAAQVRALPGAIVLPAFSAKQALSGAAEFTGDGGLVIEADSATLTASLNSPSTSAYVASVSVVPDGTLPVDGITGTVVAMWHLGLFEAAVDPGWAFHVTDTLGLAVGTSLHAYVSSYDDRTWLSAGTATVGASGITSDEGAGIPLLTTLILVSE